MLMYVREWHSPLPTIVRCVTWAPSLFYAPKDRWKKARCGYLGNTPCVLLMRGGIYSEQLTRKHRC